MHARPHLAGVAFPRRSARNSCVTTPRYSPVQDGTQRSTVPAAQRAYQRILAGPYEAKVGVRGPRPASGHGEAVNATALPSLCKGVEVRLREDANFDALYREVGPRLWRAILAYTAGRSDITDDVVAEAFARTLESGTSVRDPARYVFRVAFRLAAAELRRAPTTDRLLDSSFDDDPGLVELFDVLARLSPGQRAAIVLRYEANLPVEEVAQLMGTSSGVVRVQLLRGRRRLAQLLGDDDDE